MADDIDIEEHDVMDNPRIKNIFPDITNIKIEVDYEDEENIMFEEEDLCQPHHSSTVHHLENNDSINFFPSKIILGSKPSTSHTSKPVFQNKIILGNKACPIETSEKNYLEDDPKLKTTTTVALKDWSAILANSPCFCQCCEILFPTVNALDFHRMTTHSLLVAVGNNKAVKSTSKGSLPTKCKDETIDDMNNKLVRISSKGSLSTRLKVEPSDDRKDLICNHCNEIFPNEIALIKHTYELLPGKFECEDCQIEFDSEAACKSHQLSHARTHAYLLCPICTCHFKLTAKLQTHMWNNHRKPLCQIKPVMSKFECHYCPSKSISARYYNSHITYSHFHLYTKKSEDDDSTCKFKCTLCNISFSSDYALRIHRAAKHSIDPKPNMLQSVKTKQYIPESVLFKCNKCQIHFVSCSAAVDHANRCLLKKGNWKCQKCRRMFLLSDRYYHDLQHQMADKIRVFETNANILSRLLIRCKKCMVFFDEISLNRYHAIECSPECPSIKCDDCFKRIHPEVFAAHKKLHAGGITLADFIVVTYIAVDQPAAKQLLITNSDKLQREYKNMFFYCPTCKCFLKRNRDIDKHNIGKCNSTMSKTICKLCGLRFTTKRINNHKIMHKNNPKWKLSDCEFRNIQTGKKIKPPFPDFKKCKRCHVRFCSALALDNHVCDSEEPKICVYCREKFSDLAFNLHLPYHEYGGKPKTIINNEKIPELIKKYESLKTLWNILFLCQTCDTVTDTYDKVVVHCQDHFSNMESYNVNIKHCRKCNLNFVDDCFLKHEELHLSDEIQKESFKILVYKYDALLSDDWLNIFESLTKEQVDLILSKSMYRHTRSVRMTVKEDGHPELTLYQCGVCELILPATKVTEHSQIQNCTSIYKKFACSICSLLFASKNHKEFHENLHETLVLGDKSHRILQFFAQEQLHSIDTNYFKRESEELKFIRCQHCGKLINKAKYKSHMNYHSSMKDKKVLTMQKLKKSENNSNIVHKCYVCKKCNLSVAKSRIRTHKCSSQTGRRKCPKCSLWIRYKTLDSHMKFHNNYPFTKFNTSIVFFRDGKILNERRNRLKENEDENMTTSVFYYECANCKICLRKKINISKHACKPDTTKVVCEYCHLTFIKMTCYPAHINLHKTGALTKVNIFIYKFGPGGFLQGSAKMIDYSDKSTDIHRKKINAENSKVEKEIHSKVPKRPPSSLSNYSEEVKKKPKLSIKKSKLDFSTAVNFELSDLSFRKYVSYRYFKCKVCKLLFVTGSALIAHENLCNNENESEKCQDCGLIFHSSVFKIHKTSQRCQEKKLSDIYILTIHSKGKNQRMKYNWIYLCRQCNIYNMSFSGMKDHIGAGHYTGVRIDKCDKCNISFSRTSFKLHQQFHHGSEEIPLSDLNIAVMECAVYDKSLESEQLNDNNYNNVSDSVDRDEYSSMDDKTSITECNMSENILETSNKRRNEIGIFNCEVCDTNFIKIESLKAHQRYGNHNEKKCKCPECNLYFGPVSLKRHMILHHKKVRKNLSLSNNQTGLSTLETNSNDSIAQGEATICTNASASLSVVQENQITTDENSNKLFKCSLCDIYFLTAEQCYDHASSHTALDPTEYIACKICDLQFLCENLGKHMKSHRDKTFCMDDLIVTEYQLVGGKVHMDTYSAVDRLKLKLVSTTTHSDVEEDKAEADMNCVDSTTENMESEEGSKAAADCSQLTLCDTEFRENCNNETSMLNSEADCEISET